MQENFENRHFHIHRKVYDVIISKFVSIKKSNNTVELSVKSCARKYLQKYNYTTPHVKLLYDNRYDVTISFEKIVFKPSFSESAP